MLLLITTASAFGGTFFGKRLLNKLSLKAFKVYVACAIMTIGTLLALKII